VRQADWLMMEDRALDLSRRHRDGGRQGMVANELATVRGMYGRITSASLFRISGIAGSDPDSENNRDPQSDHIVEIISHVVLIIAAVLGSVGHAWMTSRQEFQSRRTVFDCVLSGMFGALYPVIPLDRVLDSAGLGFLALPGITSWPYVSQFAYMLGVGYMFSSFIPSVLAKFNVPLPDTGVHIIPKM
jgi:hypothetical protein